MLCPGRIDGAPLSTLPVAAALDRDLLLADLTPLIPADFGVTGRGCGVGACSLPAMLSVPLVHELVTSPGVLALRGVALELLLLWWRRVARTFGVVLPESLGSSFGLLDPESSWPFVGG